MGLIIDPHRFGAAFSPSDMANVAVWLRADLGITKDGGDAISQWDFENGTFRSVNKVTQASSSNKPTHIASDAAYNNQSTVSFGGDDYLDGANFSSALAQPTTFFIVGDVPTTPQNFIDRAGGAGRYSFGRSAADKFSMYQGTSLNSTPSGDANINIFEGVFNGASSEMFLNGTSIASGDAGTDSTDSIRIGDNIVLTGGLTGKFAELVIINGEAPAGDRTSFRNYASSRYNITLP